MALENAQISVSSLPVRANLEAYIPFPVAHDDPPVPPALHSCLPAAAGRPYSPSQPTRITPSNPIIFVASSQCQRNERRERRSNRAEPYSDFRDVDQEDEFEEYDKSVVPRGLSVERTKIEVNLVLKSSTVGPSAVLRPRECQSSASAKLGGGSRAHDKKYMYWRLQFRHHDQPFQSLLSIGTPRAFFCSENRSSSVWD